MKGKCFFTFTSRDGESTYCHLLGTDVCVVGVGGLRGFSNSN